jgi:hypothetical protein
MMHSTLPHSTASSKVHFGDRLPDLEKKPDESGEHGAVGDVEDALKEVEEAIDDGTIPAEVVEKCAKDMAALESESAKDFVLGCLRHVDVLLSHLPSPEANAEHEAKESPEVEAKEHKLGMEMSE